MDREELRRLIDTKDDFIFSKRFENSLHNFQERYPEGAPTRVIAQCLMMTEDEVEEVYQSVILKLRKIMKV